MKEAKFRQNLRQYAIIGVLLLLVLFFSLTQDAFLRVGNIMNILRQISVMGIVAVGSTFVLLSGGLDLSVGSLIAVTGTLTGTLMVNFGVNPWAAALLGILASVLLGAFNGILVQFVQLPPMIATLGVMTSARGAAYLISGGLPVYNLPETMKFLGKGSLGVIPVPVIIMLVCFAIGWVVLETGHQLLRPGRQRGSGPAGRHSCGALPGHVLCHQRFLLWHCRYCHAVPRELRPACRRHRHGDERHHRLRPGRCLSVRRRG